MEKTNKSII